MRPFSSEKFFFYARNHSEQALILYCFLCSPDNDRMLRYMLQIPFSGVLPLLPF